MPTERHATYTPWKAILQLEAHMEDGKIELNTYEYRLMLKLIIESSGSGLIKTNYQQLSKSAGVSRTTTARAVPSFQEAGLIECLAEPTKGSPGLYRVTL